MATALQIKNALDQLSDSGMFNKDELTKEVVKQQIKQQFSHYDDTEIDRMAEDIVKEGSAKIVKETKAKLAQLSGMVSTIQDSVTNLTAQLGSIPTVAANPYASSAAAPLLSGLKASANSVKSQLTQFFSVASELNIDIPGIDPLIAVIPMLSPLM